MAVQVSIAEAQILRAVQTLFRIAPGGASRLRVAADAPRRVSPDAMRVLQSTLRKGSIASLVRRGAWRERRAWVDGEARTGRLWTLRPLELRFTRASFALCRWIASSTASPPPAPESVGDALLYYLAADALRRASLPFNELHTSPLVALAFPEGRSPDIDWATFVKAGSVVIEALRDDLAAHWVRAERAKCELDAEALIAIGAAQREVLDPFLDALEAARRPDLATFLVHAASKVIGRPATSWVSGLATMRTTLAQRSEATRASAAFLDSVRRLATWRRQWAMVRFMDDEYDEAQLHLDAWDVLGQAGFERAIAIGDELHSLRELT